MIRSLTAGSSILASIVLTALACSDAVGFAGRSGGWLVGVGGTITKISF